MGTVEENRSHWEAYDWSGGGEEWSQVWGGSAVQWENAILPRIQPYLPAGRVLEIACGAGRWSVQLRRWARRLTLVDLSAPAIEACRARFAGDRAVACFRNDGRDLSMVSDRAVDFVFSFDSLVHCELPELAIYLSGLAAKLAPNGVGFIHHSNFGAVLAAAPGSKNLHWRAESVSAEGFADACRAAGLVCTAQEIVDWGGVDRCDCFSVFTLPGSRWARVPVRVENPYFMAEAASLRLRASLLPESAHTGTAPPRGEEAGRGLLYRLFSALRSGSGRGL
jgi:SAM-dependent methyltransferase